MAPCVLCGTFSKLGGGPGSLGVLLVETQQEILSSKSPPAPPLSSASRLMGSLGHAEVVSAILNPKP